MDQRLETSNRAIYVDLDGTLLRTDLLWESLFQALRRNPLVVFALFGWLMKGIAYTKARLAEIAGIDVTALPYRSEVVEQLNGQRAMGRRIVLATGSNEKLAHEVAGHLGLFDDVLASDEETNLTSVRKLERIEAETGGAGFEYYGNSHHDICLFEAASEAIVVAPDRAANQWQKQSGANRINASESELKAALQAMRPHQWLKNALIFVPAVLAHDIFVGSVFLSAALAFVAFSLSASAIYILNDLMDLEADRKHKTKWKRPFASGRLSVPNGLVLAFASIVAAFVISVFLPIEFAGILLLYLFITTAYSLSVKRMLLLDVFVLAGLYTIRVLAGGVAASIEYSFWLLAFSVFFFLSLALVKRFTELQQVGEIASREVTGRGYRHVDLETISQAGMTSGFAAVLVLALYIQSPAIEQAYALPQMIWLLCPLILYIIMRIWILARRDEMHEDPIVFILKDWRSQLMIGCGALLFLIAAIW
ncbi:UbiA family prenyltransferase [Labrenzia sp. DG1229]|uniref:UbiA family prenyltransferase n=1 Tax=Labrenzia sp. DG1229 TaxID=681847 RepID=UPI00048F222D|nr:UbiA family prenyltransferase [Labrenzia sp. DG1229]